MAADENLQAEAKQLKAQIDHYDIRKNLDLLHLHPRDEQVTAALKQFATKPSDSWKARQWLSREKFARDHKEQNGGDTKGDIDGTGDGWIQAKCENLAKWTAIGSESGKAKSTCCNKP